MLRQRDIDTNIDMETDTEKERSVVFNTSRLIESNKGLGRALRKYRHRDALKREKILLTIKTFCPSPVLNVLNCDKKDVLSCLPSLV